MNANPSAEWLTPRDDIEQLDEDPPKQCVISNCRCFLKQEWNAELGFEEDERGRERPVVVYWNDCPRCGNRLRKIV